jgi:Raf kinase inhibitor-like YbhB/YbcL family protein
MTGTMAIEIKSPAFAAYAPIPKEHTGEGRDVSPPLAWTGVPAGTRELALICDDPDAPTPEPWVHWVLYGLPAETRSLAAARAGCGTEGTNSWSSRGYRGPMPPRGHGMHHYSFRVYALDTELDAGAGLSKPELLAAIDGHVLGTGELIGTYERRG